VPRPDLASAITQLEAWLGLEGSGSATTSTLVLPAETMATLLQNAAAGDQTLAAGLPAADNSTAEALAGLEITAVIGIAQRVDSVLRAQQSITVFNAAGGAGLVHVGMDGRASLVVPAGPAFRPALVAAARGDQPAFAG
jgi:hypothetical protein